VKPPLVPTLMCPFVRLPIIFISSPILALHALKSNNSATAD
jgi:hypothetical protein